MRRSGTIKKYLTKRYFRILALKLKDFLTSETARNRSKNIIGLKEYNTQASKIFAYTWRLSIAVFFIFTFAFGFNPFVAIEKTILALGGTEGSVELNASSCVSDYAVLDTDLGWWRERNAVGQVSVSSIAGIGLFDNINSAVYNGGNFNLSCGDFQQSGPTEEKTAEIKTEEIQVVPEVLTSTTTETVEETVVSTSSADEITEEIIEATEQSSTTATQIENIAQTPAGGAIETMASDAQSVDAEVVTLTEETSQPAVVETVTSSAEPIVEQPVEVIELSSETVTAEVMSAPSENGNIITRIFSPIVKYISKQMKGFMAIAMDEKSLEEFGTFAGAKVKMSFAVTKKIQDNIIEESEKPVMIVWYAIDEASTSASSTLFWQELTTITAGEISNETNGGYLSLDIPGLKGWDDLRKVKVRLEGKSADNDYRAFIDSVWLEGVYENKSEMKKNVTESDRARWKTMMEVISDKDDFKMDERVDMRFKYKKNFRTLATIFDMTSYWADVNLSASLVDVNGSAVGLPLTIIFEDDGYFNVRAIDMPREFRPGKYSVKFSIEDGSGVTKEFIDLSHDFSWGVLAVNTNKSIYLPDESSYIQMAVLDDLGHTICDANLSMTITAPDGGVAELSTANGLIERNPECGPDNVISTPDYFAHYGVAGAGTYNISLTASTGSGDKTITDKFEVRDSVPFDIERIGPTRIFPKADYTMKVKIKINEDYNGNIIDVVPNSFKITNYELKITNKDNEQSVIRNSRFVIGEDGQQIIVENVNLNIGDEAELVYNIDFPDISPEFYLVGPLSIGSFSETRKWQIASDAVAYRAKTVQFMGGTYTGNGTTGQNTDTNQTFSQFNFKLMENSVTIKNAYIVLEYMYGAYTASQGPYTGANLVFDACSGAGCGTGPNAWTGTSSVALNDTTTQAYNETEANMQRVLLDVTNEAQLASYSGNGSLMQAQIGYRVNRGGAVPSISYAKAVLYVTYTYDKNSSPNLTNTVVYPLESTASGDSGTRRNSTSTNCIFGISCPAFNYNMDIPEFDAAAGSSQLSQWFQVNEENDVGTVNDITVNLKIGANATSSNFVHEAVLGDQSTLPQMFFSSVAGYSENSSQTVEYRAAGTNSVHYLIGGEVVETYSASSSAPIKTRTVSFPIGVITNGLTTATTTGYADIYFPENSTATGTVSIKKAWFRITSNDRASAAYTTNVQAKVGNNASSSPVLYSYNAAATIAKPTFGLIHAIPSSEYAEMEDANAISSKRIFISTRNSNAVNIGGVTAELMITYSYSDESKGYLSNLNVFAGQQMTAPAQSTTTPAANLVAPEFAGKTMYGGTLKASYLTSGSGGAMTATSSIADINISTAGSPVCTNSFRLGVAAVNASNEFNKAIAGSNLGVSDNQALTACYSQNNGSNLPNQLAKMNGYLNYTYGWVNTPPTSTIELIVNKLNGTGIVDLMFTADDVDKDDLKAKLEYEAGTTCAFSSASKLTLDSVASSTYGTINIDNASAYQVGTGTNMVITSSGANTVEVDWPTKSNLNNIDDTYCVRLITNDGVYDQTEWATSTVLIDNLAPTDPGALTDVYTLATSTYLTFGATTTENHFAEYKIFYKIYDGTPVDELDTAITSSTVPALGDKDFLSATSTKLTLTESTHYVFNIWAYDTFGNEASSTQMDFYTNGFPVGIFNSAAQKVNGSGRIDVSFDVSDPNLDPLRAKIEYESGSSCAFSSPTRALIDTNPANISFTYGAALDIDNASEYQIGTSSNWILVPATSTVSVDWLSKSDIPTANGMYCLRLTVNDDKDNQLVSATTTLVIDNTDPTAPGALSDGGRTINSINLAFGATSTDSNFSLYKIFYKVGTSGVTESDTPVSDGNLNNVNFNGATSTPISGLLSNTDYVFNIWAYDQNGNKASSTEISIRTNASVSNDSLTFTNPQSGNIAIGNGTSEYNFRAVVTELSGWHVIASTTLRLANSSDNSASYDDLVFKWDETTESFSEIGTDAMNAVEISPNSTSTCAVNTCTLDFKIKFNFNFATSSTNYNAELISSNDSAVFDYDVYNNVYQVKTIKVSQTHYRWRNDNGGN